MLTSSHTLDKHHAVIPPPPSRDDRIKHIPGNDPGSGMTTQYDSCRIVLIGTHLYYGDIQNAFVETVKKTRRGGRVMTT